MHDERGTAAPIYIAADGLGARMEPLGCQLVLGDPPPQAVECALNRQNRTDFTDIINKNPGKYRVF